MTSLDPPLCCGSYTPGHEAHYIQARLSREEDPIGSGTAAVDAHGWITLVLDDGDSIRRWTHDPVRLAQQLQRTQCRAELRTKGVLAVASPRGAYIVSIAEAPSPCPSPDEDTSPWTLEEIISRRGGFLISGDDPRLRQRLDPANPVEAIQVLDCDVPRSQTRRPHGLGSVFER